jgi:TolB-like protein/Tfp pilus assembly protein PilF
MSEETDRANVSPSTEDRLSLLWRRVKEHRIAQWTVGYIAVAYAIQHAVILTSESFEWPNAIARISMLLLALGLPFAVTLAWYHGHSANRRISGGELAIVSTLLVIGAFLFYTFARPVAEIATGPATAKSASASSLGVSSPTLPGGIAIAVLPFVNLSSDKEQEFFSDGMTDEIMTALAKIQRLSVVARESAFQYKGERNDMRAVGQALNAQYLINGSVRRAGNRVRITAQLVRSNDGVGLWTDSYDRELTDIFAIQEGIAQAIAGALSVPLGLRQGQQLVSSRTGNLDTYQQYLRAKAAERARAPVEEQIATLEALVARDPTYAPAWALLARDYGFSAGNNVFALQDSSEEMRVRLSSGLAKAEMAAREAIRLDPLHSGGYSALGDVENRRGHKLAAEELREKAMALDPGDTENLERHAAMLGGAGHLQDALRIKKQLAVLEPFVPAYNTSYANLLLSLGERQTAIRMLEAIPPDPNIQLGRNVALARGYIAERRYAEAADLLLAAAPAAEGLRSTLETAARILRAPPSNASSQGPLPLVLPMAAFAYVGAYDRVMDGYERNLDIGNGFAFTHQTWAPEFAPLRKTERFKRIMRRAGYVDYWRVKGWPDLCHPVGADDFACE